MRMLRLAFINALEQINGLRDSFLKNEVVSPYNVVIRTKYIHLNKVIDEILVGFFELYVKNFAFLSVHKVMSSLRENRIVLEDLKIIKLKSSRLNVFYFINYR